MSAAVDASLVAAVTRLARALRARGALATPGEAVAAAQALETVDVADRDEVYLALRTILTSRPEDYRIFDEEFARHLSTDARSDAGAEEATSAALPTPAVRREAAAVTTLRRWLRATGAEEEDAAGVPQPSDRESLARRDLRRYSDDELDAVTRVARRLARRLAARRSRRWKPAARGPRVHLRRTMRRAVETGTAAALAFRERKRRRTKLVVIADISGSMELYARFVLQVLYALQNAFAHVETFVFATRLTRITAPLTAPRFRAALDAVAEETRDFAGGTRIGASLDAFERDWGRLLDRRTVAIVVSDGWDTGDPALVGDALARIRERAGRVIWLNPLLGSPGYQPLARGMQAALPHIDVLHPAHDAASLEALARHLAL